eukprot:scaffold329254_cov43-Prasinocladus_malaysianus.AAC.1
MSCLGWTTCYVLPFYQPTTPAALLQLLTDCLSGVFALTVSPSLIIVFGWFFNFSNSATRFLSRAAYTAYLIQGWPL